MNSYKVFVTRLRIFTIIKTTQFLHILSILILFVCKISHALPINDSLHIQVWTGAAAIYQEPVGLKGSAAGVVDTKLKHTFSSHIYAELALNLSSSYPLFFLENASLGFKQNNFAIQSGMISEHIGRAVLYKPFSVYNKFIRSSTIWESNGFGVAIKQQSVHFGFSAAATLNNRENGSAYCICTATDNNIITNRILLGLQTGEIQYNDNSLTIGNDLNINLNKKFELHCAIKYCNYQGYGTASINPGYNLVLFNETKNTFFPGLSLSTMIYYEQFEKNYSYTTLHCGINSEYLVFHWIGIYAGYEYQNNTNIVLKIPEAGLSIVPIPNTMNIRIGGEFISKGSALISRAQAVVWYEF